VARSSADFSKKVQDESRLWKSVVIKSAIKVE
jgi:hypothetical protein